MTTPKAVDCPRCREKTFTETTELYRSLADEMAVWVCSDPACGYREGRATGKRATFDLTTAFRHSVHL